MALPVFVPVAVTVAMAVVLMGREAGEEAEGHCLQEGHAAAVAAAALGIELEEQEACCRRKELQHRPQAELRVAPSAEEAHVVAEAHAGGAESVVEVSELDDIHTEGDDEGEQLHAVEADACFQRSTIAFSKNNSF